MPTRLLVAMLTLATSSAADVPDPSPLPDGVFYAIRMISPWYGGNELLRIEPGGTVEVVGTLLDDDGPVLYVGGVLVWHPIYKRLFGFDAATLEWISINPTDGHVEAVIEGGRGGQADWLFADFTVIPNDPLLYGVYHDADIRTLDPRVNNVPEVQLHGRGCWDLNPESLPRGIAYIDRADIPQAGFYIRYSDCPLGSLNLLAAPDGRSYWIGAPLSRVKGLFWDRGTQRLYEWDQATPEVQGPLGPVQFWIIDPITGTREFAFQWDFDFDLLALDFVPSADIDIINCLPADITGDNEIDLRDFAALQNCMMGPPAPPLNP